MAAESEGNLAAEHPDVTSFEATVQSVDGRNVTLDRTQFYPEGGGQPADRGSISEVAVADVQNQDGTTVHTLETEPTFETGEEVVGRIDETFRTYAMRAHTASHVVYGAGRELLEDHGYGGFDIGEERIRLDFTTAAEDDAVNALTIQRMANEVVWDGRPVDWYEMDVEAAETDEEIVFNLGDDVEVADTVRIVEIEDWDIAACGGTHVRNTTEIGPITVLEVSNPGAGLVRVEYAVGPTAIQQTVEKRRRALRAAEIFDTSVQDLPTAAERLRAENQSLQNDIEELSESLLDSRLRSLQEQTFESDGQEWLVGTVEAVGPNTVSDRLADLLGEAADVIALAGTDGSTFVVAGTGGETDASAIVNEVTDEFGGGGGGRPTMAQGGGIDSDPETVVKYLREEVSDE